METSEIFDTLKSTVILSSTEHMPNWRLDGSERFAVGIIALIGIKNDPSPVTISIESANTLFSNGLNVTGSVCEVPEPKTIGCGNVVLNICDCGILYAHSSDVYTHRRTIS